MRGRRPRCLPAKFLQRSLGMLPFEDIERVINQILPAGGVAGLRARGSPGHRISVSSCAPGHLICYIVLVSLRATTARLALGHLTTAVTVTSNGQMVQPNGRSVITLRALSVQLNRTTSRLREAYARLNRSPLGSVSGMSTAIPVRRERLAALLGFDGLVEHTFDALAVADVSTSWCRLSPVVR